ncbi:LysR family transcriptional regulator [Variovorax terrae]|uniref:LysR family transcriptional regulator n=1 Tax=Variovorax terrae TaxID=2923278 RepID=A0A9X1VYA2_9BURK|nr:LysR family transcriptional regulator [Variovorax terrae]MCJ0765508.1 LysR family transcriptional regulator [Variovorax terrae]
MHLRDLDLNLLKVFDAVYRLRSVSRAADALGLTQSAVSHRIGQLRVILKSPLFLRVPSGVKPTPKADRLAVAVQMALATLERAVEESEQFDPALSHKTFRFHLSDVGERAFLPRLSRALETATPNITLASFQFPDAEIESALHEGAIHYAIGYLPQLVGCHSHLLLEDTYGLVVRTGHPVLDELAASPGSVEPLLKLEFVVSKAHAHGLRVLEQLGAASRVRVTTSQEAAVPSIVRESGLAGIVALRCSQALGALDGCQVVPTAITPVSCNVSLYWSRRFDANVANGWLRARLLELFPA